MTSTLVQRIQYLEEKFAFQEQTLDALNDVILDQQTQINELQDHIAKLKGELLAQQQTGENIEPPPPHY